MDGLELLLDERAIRQVMLRYARGVDDRDWEQVTGCFAPDAYVAGTGHSGERDEYLATLVTGVSRYGVTMHSIANQVVEVDGDSASSETDLVARHFADDEGKEESLVMGVRYHDRLRRDGERWVITRRDVRRLWSRP
jgi:3-phenylpropionate/cinnamic acid dioxygenase small subunit